MSASAKVDKVRSSNRDAEAAAKFAQQPRTSIHVYLAVRTIYRRNMTIAGFVAQWLSRASGEVVYLSSKCATEAKAEELATRFRARNSWLMPEYPINTPAEATPYALRKVASKEPIGSMARRALFMAAERIEALGGRHGDVT